MLSAHARGQPGAWSNDLGFAPYPAVDPGETPKVTLGGMNYAISTYSKHPDEAFEAGDVHAQRRRTRCPPRSTTVTCRRCATVFDDPEFIRGVPDEGRMLEELKNAVPRPVTPVYQNISTIVSTTLSPPPAINPQATADKLRSSIQDAIEGKGILP